VNEFDPIERSLRRIEQARLRAQGLLREHADAATQERLRRNLAELERAKTMAQDMRRSSLNAFRTSLTSSAG